MPCCCAVVPGDSAWFSFFNGRTLVPLFDQDLYKEDWIGLQQLHAKGALLFEEAPGEHMRFSLAWFDKHIVQAHLRGTAVDAQSR